MRTSVQSKLPSTTAVFSLRIFTRDFFRGDYTLCGFLVPRRRASL
jgi:hypothetical protein